MKSEKKSEGTQLFLMDLCDTAPTPTPAPIQQFSPAFPADLYSIVGESPTARLNIQVFSENHESNLDLRLHPLASSSPPCPPFSHIPPPIPRNAPCQAPELEGLLARS